MTNEIITYLQYHPSIISGIFLMSFYYLSNRIFNNAKRDLTDEGKSIYEIESEMLFKEVMPRKRYFTKTGWHNVVLSQIIFLTGAIISALIFIGLS